MSDQPTNPNRPTVNTLLYEAERKMDLFNKRTQTMRLKFDFNHTDPDEATVRKTIDLMDKLLEMPSMNA